MFHGKYLYLPLNVRVQILRLMAEIIDDPKIAIVNAIIKGVPLYSKDDF